MRPTVKRRPVQAGPNNQSIGPYIICVPLETEHPCPYEDVYKLVCQKEDVKMKIYLSRTDSFTLQAIIGYSDSDYHHITFKDLFIFFGFIFMMR